MDIEAAKEVEPPDIVITWEEWKRGREAKRALLRRLGLDKPCRRAESSSDKRLRHAFGGDRGTAFVVEGPATYDEKSASQASPRGRRRGSAAPSKKEESP